MSLHDLQNATQTSDPTSSFHEDFLEQMLCGLQSAGVSWPEISTATGGAGGVSGVGVDLFDDQSAFLTTKLRQHQISNGDLGFFQNEMVDTSSFKPPNGNGSIQPLFSGFNGSLQPNQTPNFQYPHAQSFRAPSPATAPVNQGPTSVGATTTGGGGSGQPAQPRQKVRARRGQATDPHSIAERLRRERIAERMKSLQELVPNANKTDKASMLDEIIDYVKFLQLQVKVLSMSRMGGVAAVAPLVTDVSSEGGRDNLQVTSGGGGTGRTTNGTPPASSSTNETMTVAENQVVKLMEEDMGSAMQYLQGKGLCLMPISLATAISTATTTTTRNNHPLLGSNGDHHHLSPNPSVFIKDPNTVNKS